MYDNVGKRLIKVAVASLVVGVLLAAFDIEPRNLLKSFGETIESIFDVIVELIEWAVPYVLLGAVVVVPIWLIMLVSQAVRDRKK